MLIAFKKNKFIVSFIIIFGTLSFPIRPSESVTGRERPSRTAIDCVVIDQRFEKVADSRRGQKY